MTESEAKAKLRSLGARRRNQQKRDRQLFEDTREALTEVRGTVSMSAAAGLLGLERSTIYQVYLPQRK